MKNKNKVTKLETPNKVKKGFHAYVAIVTCLTLMLCGSVTAFAAGDPITVVNNLSSFIFPSVSSFSAGVSFRLASVSSPTTRLSAPTAS